MGFGEGSVGQLGAREARREISRDMGRYREIKGDIGSAAPEKPGVRAASRCATWLGLELGFGLGFGFGFG